ncbi:very short patch repair endonuclease [Hyphomicrobium sp. ghe19]|uniref:very short patch repair endonuclease n=1 Tax=Hyphomicrobium sp. ghe19 TaxID=2682968 RepID=UPI00136788B3|nr:Very short patch repair protein [Hyphomicrobium sp. ghe19]
MTDKLTPEQRSENMSRIRHRDMKPEMVVRRTVHSLGKRFRLHGAYGANRLPGKPDLVFAALRKVIFVHGCFWHQHNSNKCQIVRKPRSNNDYWDRKLDGNVQRDARHVNQLKASGWDVLTVWECEVTRPGRLVKRLRSFLRI